MEALVVDDTTIVRELIAEALQSLGVQVQVAASLAEASEARKVLRLCHDRHEPSRRLWARPCRACDGPCYAGSCRGFEFELPWRETTMLAEARHVSRSRRDEVTPAPSVTIRAVLRRPRDRQLSRDRPRMLR